MLYIVIRVSLLMKINNDVQFNMISNKAALDTVDIAEAIPTHAVLLIFVSFVITVFCLVFAPRKMRNEWAWLSMHSGIVSTGVAHHTAAMSMFVSFLWSLYGVNSN